MQYPERAKTDSGDSPPGLLRRLAAIVYDSLLLCGVLILISLPLPLVPHPINEFWWVRLLIQLYLMGFCLLFFGWFWTHGGQTLGMRAWRFKVVQLDGAELNWRLATIRFLAAILSWMALGAGFLWVLFDKDKKSWHDRLSRTILVRTHRPEQSQPKSTEPE